MSEMVHIGGGLCSLERRGGAGRTWSRRSGRRSSKLSLATNGIRPSGYTSGRPIRSESERSARLKYGGRTSAARRKADLQQDGPTARVRRRPPTQQVPCRQGPVYCDRRNKWLSI